MEESTPGEEAGRVGALSEKEPRSGLLSLLILCVVSATVQPL